ncbi:MAG: ribonuclease HII [Geminocystis sp.]|nr:ribonuclease HII [Geminocystis sp.]HIK38712.1 ribonuclease HII [Geminocystis sp. M7585_C2015_104]
MEERLIAGVDEVGRGCIFGEVVAAAVVLPLKKVHLLRQIGVTDSKTLSPHKRKKLFPLIQQLVSAYHLAEVDNTTIDRINIHQAVIQAMTKAVEGLGITPSVCLIDGPFTLTPTLQSPAPFRQIPLVRGDKRSPVIAAASILAKVWRDEKMRQYHQIYPQYDLLNNKGYPTKKHLASIARYGITPHHRLSFTPCGVYSHSSQEH